MNALAHWKTSLFGLLGFVLMSGPQIAACIKSGHCDWVQLAVGIIMGGLGISAADHNGKA